MDTAIDAEIGRLLSAFTGSDLEIPSFTSARNTDVTRVQFVIKTDGIRQEEAPVEEPKEETPTFWEKFLALFGID